VTFPDLTPPPLYTMLFIHFIVSFTSIPMATHTNIRLILACSTFLLIGCRLISGCTDTNIFTPRLITNVDDAEARWKTHQITKHSLTQRRSCFCAPQNYPLTLQIDSTGTLVSVRDARGQTVNIALGRTVPQMFADIRALQNRSDATVQVKYDSVYGYPRSISADPIKAAVDDEYSLETTLVR
jgi:Family of unknown function (DUF6174)